MSKYVDNSETLKYDGIREHTFALKGELSKMTENEKELIRLIRENDNPGQALMAAATIILGYLKQLESSEEPVAADLQELG